MTSVFVFRKKGSPSLGKGSSLFKGLDAGKNAEPGMQWGQGTWGTGRGREVVGTMLLGRMPGDWSEVRGGCGLLCMPAGYFTLDWSVW